MYRWRTAGILPALLMICASARPVWAAEADTTRVVEDEAKFGVVVSATRTLRAGTEVPAGSVVVRGETLRRHGVQTLADALADVSGLDASGGSDNGSRFPNIGLWGLKEFDALLVCVDGVPVGGPFNPALEQISLEDIDRIEILKGPQGTLYGVSAFAGMIQVFTRQGARSGAEFTERVSSFGGNAGDFSWNGHTPDGTGVRISASGERGDGSQDRTAFTRFRSTLGLSRNIGRGHASLVLTGLEDRQQWATPYPYDQGKLVDGFFIDRNDAVGGAATDHLIFGGTGAIQWPLMEHTRLEGSLGITSDRQKLLRTFVDVTSIVGDKVDSDGQLIKPTETTAYADVRLIRNQELAGPHEIVVGSAFTWGKLRASIDEFDMTTVFTPVPIVPNIDEITFAEGGDVETERHFFGAYLHDTWTPHPRVTLGGGARVDLTGEDLESEDPATRQPVRDEKEDTGYSGDGTVLLRLLPADASDSMVLNLYGNARHNFKPSAPNVTEPEGAKILDPERSTAYEGGLKGRGFDGQAAFECSVFQMDLENQVMPSQDALGNPILINAGHTRFKGEEASLRLEPVMLRGFAVEGGYAHHDSRFVVFNRDPTTSVNGKRIEMAPQELWNAAVSWSGGRGLSLWVAARGEGERPFNKRNTFFAKAYSEWDAGAAFETGPVRWSVAGRNLSNQRFVTGESEIGDSQFYVSAPRRITGAVTVRI